MRRRWSRSLLGFSLALLALAVALLGAVPASGAARRTYVAAECAGAVQRPQAMILACGDAGLVATRLHWRSWTANTAVGRGRGEAKVCKPNCAAGRVAKAPMRLRLLRPRLCRRDGKWHFTKVRYRWLGNPPAGTGPKAGTIPLPCSL